MINVKKRFKLGNWRKQSIEVGFMELSIHADGKSTSKWVFQSEPERER